MSKIKEVLRLKYLNLLSNRQIQTINLIADIQMSSCKNRSNLDTSFRNTWTPKSLLFGH